MKKTKKASGQLDLKLEKFPEKDIGNQGIEVLRQKKRKYTRERIAENHIDTSVRYSSYSNGEEIDSDNNGNYDINSDNDIKDFKNNKSSYKTNGKGNQKKKGPVNRSKKITKQGNLDRSSFLKTDKIINI